MKPIFPLNLPVKPNICMGHATLSEVILLSKISGETGVVLRRPEDSKKANRFNNLRFLSTWEQVNIVRPV